MTTAQECDVIPEKRHNGASFRPPVGMDKNFENLNVEKTELMHLIREVGLEGWQFPDFNAARIMSVPSG